MLMTVMMKTTDGDYDDGFVANLHATSIGVSKS